MKKILVFIYLFVLCLSTVYADSFPKVKLTFYLDATQSMKPLRGHNLWAESKDCLKDAINAIDYEEGTEVKICVFADAHKKGSSNNPEETLEVFSVCPFTIANELGKEKLCRFVDSLKEPGEGLPAGYETLTNLDKPLMDFINNNSGGNSNIKNVMILITDGGHETPHDFKGHLRKWHEYTDNNTYGFVVELRDIVGRYEQAAKDTMDRIIDSQKSKGRLRRTNKHDFNFKFISLNCSAESINLRETQSFELKYSTNTPKALKYIDNLQFESNNHFKLSQSKLNDSVIQIKVRNFDLTEEPLQQLLAVKCSIDEDIERENLVFLLNDSFELNCINDFSRSLNIYTISEEDVIEIKKDNRRTIGEIEYYEPCSWLASDEKMIPAKVLFRFKLNEDAIKENSSALLIFTDENGNLFDRNKIKILDNGKYSDSIVIDKSTIDKELSFEFISDNYDKDKIVGHLKLVDNKSLDSVNGANIKGQENCFLFEWEIIVDRHWNPSFVRFLWFLFLLLLLLIIYLLLLLMRRVFALRFPSNCRFFFEAEGDGENLDMYSFTYKEKPIVYPAHNHGMSSTIQTQCLRRYFIKDIFIVNSSNKTTSITKRSLFDRMWNGETLVINGSFGNKPIDFIVLKPTGSLFNVDVEVDITFNDGTHQIICLPVHLIPNTIMQTDLYSINGAMIGIRGAEIHKK